MAIHANSTPVPARPPFGAEPTPRCAEVVRLDFHRPSPDAFYAACCEFHDLVEDRKRIDARMAELLPVIDRRYACKPSPTLPKSGLSQAAPGVLLFKGGRGA